jgi:hypothetical protein
MNLIDSVFKEAIQEKKKKRPPVCLVGPARRSGRLCSQPRKSLMESASNAGSSISFEWAREDYNGESSEVSLSMALVLDISFLWCSKLA